MSKASGDEKSRMIAEEFRTAGIIPVVKMSNAEDAVPLAETLEGAGLPIIEITMRSGAAAAAMEKIRGRRPGILCGAGTILSVEQAKVARGSGAQFIVSPGFNPEVVDYCLEQEIPVYPGVNNPMGIDFAMQRGLSVVKFFPAEATGGISMIKALSAPYADARFLATGGINHTNIGDYLRLPSVWACGGSWIVSSKLIDEGRFDEVARLTREALAIIRDVRKP